MSKPSPGFVSSNVHAALCESQLYDNCVYVTARSHTLASNRVRSLRHIRLLLGPECFIATLRHDEPAAWATGPLTTPHSRSTYHDAPCAVAEAHMKEAAN